MATKLIDDIKHKPNPLVHDLVLRNLFNFVGLNDLKICRLVNKIWQTSAEIKFRKRTRVYLEFPYTGIPAELQNAEVPIQGLIPLFRLMSLIPLTSVAFAQLVPWVEAEMRHFFRNDGECITDLKLYNSQLRGASFVEILIRVNLHDFLGNVMYRNLKILHVSPMPGIGTDFIIPLQKLTVIEEVYLKGCILLLEDAPKISPKKLVLISCFVYENFNRQSQALLINDFVDMSRMKILELKKQTSRDQLLAVDMSSPTPLEVDSVTLCDAKIIRWRSANWTIGNLDLCRMNLNQLNSNIQVRAMKLTEAPSVTHLRFLPPSIQRLDLHFDKEKFEPYMNVLFNLPNLTYLAVAFQYTSVFNAFKNCPKLSAVEITKNSDSAPCPVNLSSLPKKVEKLKVSRYASYLYSSASRQDKCQLDTIVINLWSAHQLPMLINHYHPKTIVIGREASANPATVVGEIEYLHNIVNKHLLQHMVVGPFQWEHQDFQKSAIFPLVDKKGEYYSFRGGKGVAISNEDFNEICEF